MAAVQETVEKVKSIDVDAYKYGFISDIESDKAPKGLNESTVRFISAKKNEPEWLTEWRLDAYRRWLTMQEPTWARVDYPKIDYQDLCYYSAPEILARPEVARRCRSGAAAHLREARHSVARARNTGWRPEGSQWVAVDAIFDPVSVATTFRDELAKSGVIFCPISEAVHHTSGAGEAISRLRRPGDR